MTYITSNDNGGLCNYGLDLIDIPEWNCEHCLLADEIWSDRQKYPKAKLPHCIFDSWEDYWGRDVAALVINTMAELRSIDQLSGDLEHRLRVPDNLDGWTTQQECYHVMTFDTGGIHFGPRKRTAKWNKRWSTNRFKREYPLTGDPTYAYDKYLSDLARYFDSMKQELDRDKLQRMKSMHLRRLKSQTKTGEDKIAKSKVRANRSADMLKRKKSSIH